MQAGAKHVYGIDMSAIAEQAKQIVADNGYRCASSGAGLQLARQQCGTAWRGWEEQAAGPREGTQHRIPGQQEAPQEMERRALRLRLHYYCWPPPHLPHPHGPRPGPSPPNSSALRPTLPRPAPPAQRPRDHHPRQGGGGVAAGGAG